MRLAQLTITLEAPDDWGDRDLDRAARQLEDLRLEPRLYSYLRRLCRGHLAAVSVRVAGSDEVVF
jgi:hypothetical protein